MFNLKGKRALVTGASRGAGLGIAKALAQSGASVTLTARNEAGLIKTRGIVEAAGGKVDAIIPMDLSSRDNCRKLAKQAGNIDILINNAAVTSAKFQSILVRDDEYWDSEFNVNVMAPLTLIQELGPYMVSKQRGTIINISSISAQRGTPAHAPYSASKAAMDAMSKVAAMDLARDGINVVVVAFGFVETEALQEACADGLDIADIARMFVPIGRAIDVAETGALCCFLASDDAKPLTGIVINIDGGMTAGQYAFQGSLGNGVVAKK